MVLKKSTTADEINAVLEKEAKKPQNKFLLGIAPKNSSSHDVIGNPVRDLVNTNATKVVAGDFAHVESYYDNEWGYTIGLATLAATLGKKILQNKAAIAKVVK